MAAAVFVPVESYLTEIWHPDREYLDGEVQERNLGEFDHANLQTVLAGWFLIRRQQYTIRVVVEQRVQVSATRFRIPDVSVLSAAYPKEQIITRAPLICIEVLSPEDSLRKVQERICDYASFGVPNIWVFDPEKRQVWICTADAMTKFTGTVLTAADTDISIPLDEIWSNLD
jgi:Uma2 family endonuclease